MFTLAPESIKNLHVTPLTFNDTNGALTLVRGLNVNVYSSSELDGGERGLDSSFTWLTVCGGLGRRCPCFLFPFRRVPPLPPD